MLTYADPHADPHEQELRVLTLELSKFEWLYGVTTKLLPLLPKYKKEIDELRTNLDKERKESEELSCELESPANTSRCPF
jgi:hypothetical protein